MKSRTVAVIALLSAAILASSPVAACESGLGRGWPPATGNYGNAVERLFDAQGQAALSLVWLPAHGKESGLALIPGAEGADWTLRYSRADERVYNWNNSGNRGGVELRVQQTPERVEAPIPAILAQRLVASWREALTLAVPESQHATVQESDVLSFAIGGEHFSGSPPRCGPAQQLLEQAELLVEASEEKQSKRERRWIQLEALLDELKPSLASARE